MQNTGYDAQKPAEATNTDTPGAAEVAAADVPGATVASGASAPTPAESSANDAPKPKKKRRRLFIIAGIIVAVLVVAGVGGIIWHESPTFCNALCHNPMDPYVEGYYSQDPALLVTSHAAEGNECLDCHKVSIGEQLNELGAYVTGDFKSPLPMTKNGTRDFCLECHDSEAIKATTVNYAGTARNPHDSHYKDSLECYTCHRVHRESVMYCAECHPDIAGPSTWTS